MKRLLILLSMLFCTFAFADTITINWGVDNQPYTTTTCEIGGDVILPSVSKRGHIFRGWTPEHFDRGTWINWANVPTSSNLYPEDYVGNRTPTNNDYMVVSDASGYVLDLSNMPRVEFRNMRPKPDGVQGASICDVFYYPDGINEIITYNFECIENGGYRSVAGGKVLANWWYGHNWTIKANATVYYNDRYYNSGDVIYKGGNRDTIKIYFLDSIDTLQGSWRFVYDGVWEIDGKSGWKPAEQIVSE